MRPLGLMMRDVHICCGEFVLSIGCKFNDLKAGYPSCHRLFQKSGEVRTNAYIAAINLNHTIMSMQKQSYLLKFSLALFLLVPSMLHASQLPEEESKEGEGQVIDTGLIGLQLPKTSKQTPLHKAVIQKQPHYNSSFSYSITSPSILMH